MTKSIALFALLLAAAPLRADDQEAADLFYRAFWLEHAEGKADEAGALYDRVWKEFPDAPEAPRALLGLIRLRVSHGVDASELVEVLQTQYPGVGEFEQARALVAGAPAGEVFDHIEWLNSDSALKRKLAAIYDYLDAPDALDEPDRRFLVEAGAAAHPMLEAALNSLRYEAVRQAAVVLLRQEHPRSTSMLREALRKEGMPFRYAIVQALSDFRIDDRGLIEAVVALYEGGISQVQREVVYALVLQVDHGSAAADLIWPVLVRVLQEDEVDLRIAATSPNRSSIASAPEEYVRALLGRMEEGDQGVSATAYRALPGLAAEERYRDPIERVLLAGIPDWPPLSSGDTSEEAWLWLARVALRCPTETPHRVKVVGDLLRAASGASPRAAAEIMRAAIERDFMRLLTWVAPNHATAPDFGPERENLLAFALRAAVRGQARDVAARAVASLRPDPEDVELVRAVLESEAGGDLGVPLVEALAPVLPDPRAFAPALKGIGPGNYHRFCVLAGGNEALASLLAERVLDLRGQEWNWNRENRTQPGYGLVTFLVGTRTLAARLQDAPLRARLVELTGDDRLILAELAVKAALQDGNQMALHRALGSPFESIRREAIQAIDDAPALAEYLLGDLAPIAEVVALRRLGEIGTEAQADVVARLVEAGGDSLLEAWRCWLALNPEAAVASAVRNAYHEDAERRAAALDVLTRSSDPRRLEVFRNILDHGPSDNLLLVVRTIGDQYIVELGKEVVEQLRSPDPKVREAATQAIERLKFYAEARKTFE